jgi:hypothetical protein
MITSKVVDHIKNRCPSLRSLHNNNAAWLSHLFITGPPNRKSGESKAISPSAYLNNIPSRAAAPHAWYYIVASNVDAAVVACFLLDHDTASPYMVTTHPVVLRRVSLHAAKLASHQNPSDCPPYVIPRLVVPPTYRTTSSNTAE